MTCLRVDLDHTENFGFYHCISRGAHQSWLCSMDRLSGCWCEHMKVWLEHRLLMLAETAMVRLYEYLVTINHYRVVIEVIAGGH